MKKTADKLKKGDIFSVGSESLVVESIELSDAGKQGVKKCRIVASKDNKEKVVIIRPSNYPFDVK